MPSPEPMRRLAGATEPRQQLVAPFFLWPGPDTTEVLLIRHAQIPEGELAEDFVLTPLGREQAEALADFLAAPRIAAVYASPSARARETAAPIAGRHGLEVEVVEDLSDVRSNLPRDLAPREALVQVYGEAEGARRYQAMLEGGWSMDLFGELMESAQSLRGRLARAMDGLIAGHPGQRIAVVSHAPSIAAYVAHVVGSPADFFFYPRMTSITQVLASGERRQLQVLNATPHFGVL